MATARREPARTVEQVNREQQIRTALEPALREHLAATWPEQADRPMDITVRVVGFYVLSGQAWIGEDGIVADLVVGDDWDTTIGDVGHVVVDGAFILRVLERDNHGRPTAGVGMRKVTCLGEPMLTRCEFDAAWHGETPKRSWRPLASDWFEPVD